MAIGQWRIVVMFGMSVILAGCAERIIVAKGGTAGSLHSAALPINEVCVTVHRLNGDRFEVIGFAETKGDGDFELLVPDGRGPLYLEPAEYRFTLVSTGSRFPIPKVYTQPDTTPLKIEWTGEETDLNFELPAPANPY